MSKTKWRLIPSDRWNAGMLESWLEDEAAKGWLLVSGGSRLAKFERAEPRQCRMRLEPAVPESPEERDAKDEAYRDLGWERICELGDYQVSVCFDPRAPELQTDPVAEGWALEKVLKKAWRGWLMTWPTVLALYALLIWVILSLEAPMESLLRTNSLLLLFGFAQLPPLLWATVRSLQGIRALRRQLKAGLPRSHSGDWKRSRRRAVADLVLFVAVEACILCYPFYQAFGSWSARLNDLPEPIPYLTGEAMDPELTDSLRDWDCCWRETGFLAPDRYEVTEVWNSADARMDTTCDILRFRFLAEGLYEEQAERVRKSCPDTWVELTHPDFDRLLLAESPNGEFLVARKDRAVLSVAAVGVEGLEEHLPDYAAVLAAFP